MDHYLLCMYCAEQPANPDFLNLVCSQECLSAIGNALEMPKTRPEEGRIVGAGLARTDVTSPFAGLTVQELGMAYCGAEIGEDMPARSAPWPLILRRLDFELFPSEPVTFVHVWLALVRMPDSSIVVKAQWYPYEQQTRFAFENVPYDVTPKQLANARRALTLYRQGKLTGTNPGPRLMTIEDFRSRLDAELDKAGYHGIEDREFLPTQEDLIPRFGFGDGKTFRRYLKNSGVGWPPRRD